MSDDKAAQAREGLLDSVAGKAKEVAGAVSGKDELVEEGQLQQAEARKRKAAVADEAVADAKRDEAAQELRDANREANEGKSAAHARADREESAVEQQRETEHATAAADAEREAAQGREAAERQAEELAESRLGEAETLEADADTTQQQGEADKVRLEREAAVADQQAAQLRAETEN